MLHYTASQRASCVLKGLPGSQPVRSSVNVGASALHVSGKQPLPPPSEASSRRKLEKDSSFPTRHFKREKSIDNCRSSKRGLWSFPAVCLEAPRKGKVWQSSQLYEVRQGLGGAEPVRGALLFSLPCSAVAHDWELLEQLKSAVTTKVQARSESLTEKLCMVFTRSTQSNFWRCNRDPWGRL